MSAASMGLGVTLVIGPERMSALQAIQPALAVGRPTLVVGGPTRDRQSPTGLARLGPTATAAEIRAWLDRVGADGLVVVDGAASIAEPMMCERLEDRVARLAVALAPAGREQICVIEPLLPAQLLAGGPWTTRLEDAGVAVLVWDGETLTTLAEQEPGAMPWLVSASAVSALAAAAALVPSLAGRGDTDRLIGDIGQNLPRALWLDWWVRDRVLSGHAIGWTDKLYWPVGADVVATFHNLGAAALSLPFQLLFGYPGFWVPFVAFALVCNGVAAAWMARQFGADRPSSLLAAAIFAASPALLGEVAQGAQDVFFAAPLALAIGLGVRALDGRRAQAVYAGLALGFASLIWWFYGAFTIVVVGVVSVDRLYRRPARRRQLVDQLGWILRAALPASVALLPLLADANRRPSQTLGWMGIPSAPGDAHLAQTYFEGAIAHALPLTRLVAWPTGDRDWAMGAVALALVVLGLLWRPAATRFWAGVVAVAAVLAAGPALSPTWQLADGWTPLPLGLLQSAIPPLRYLDHPDRLMVLGALGLAVVAANLARALRPVLLPGLRAPALGLGILVAIATPAINGVLPLPTFDADVPGWVTAIQAESGSDEGAVVHVPMGWSELPMVWQPLTGGPISGGPNDAIIMADRTAYRAQFDERPSLAFFWTIERGALDQAGLAELHAMGARFVVVHTDAINALTTQLEGDRGWQMPLVAERIRVLFGPAVYKADGVEVYRVPDSIPPS